MILLLVSGTHELIVQKPISYIKKSDNKKIVPIPILLISLYKFEGKLTAKLGTSSIAWDLANNSVLYNNVSKNKTKVKV